MLLTRREGRRRDDIPATGPLAGGEAMALLRGARCDFDSAQSCCCAGAGWQGCGDRTQDSRRWRGPVAMSQG
eukprot:scaffold3092_cov121-Isochrysis_galbana.AAC.12